MYLYDVNLSFASVFVNFIPPHHQDFFSSILFAFLASIYFQFLRMNIYVSNLSFNVQDEDLREFFTPFGEVSSAKVIMDRISNQSRGFGFIEMPDEAASRKAIAELDGATVENRTIKVTEARPKEQRSDRSNNGGGYNNGKSYNQNRY
jgi:RNA recognition motif-containing protein